MASGDKFYLADKDTLDEVNGKIGSTTDTGGSSSVGTVMAKGNAILAEVGKIGITNDEQSSSTTTGSIFAKLNYLVSQVSLYLSDIYTRLGAQADSNTTGSKSSTVHGKLNWFIDLLGKTNDTGGTTTAGTLLAKANAMLTDMGIVAEHISSNVLDNDVIKAGTNQQNFSFHNLPTDYIEVLNVTGEGYLNTISLKSINSSVVKIKIYIDNVLFFDFGACGSHPTTAYSRYLTCLVFAGTGMYSGSMIPYLNAYANGNIINLVNTGTEYIPNRLIHFKNNLRILACSSVASTNDLVSINYALKG